ncbi:MAG: phosphatidylglycerol lysyltransferase domain-containing protein [Candidatus Omnitrophota bacterium]
MNLNKLTLKDKKLFNTYLAQDQHDLAVFSFANIYIWRCLYKINWVILEDSLCIFFQDAVGCFMYLPPLAREIKPAVIKASFSVMDGINKNKSISRIENIPEKDLANYRALGYLVNDKYPDYLCARNDLANLRGNKYKSQRAAYNYFIKHYDFVCQKLKLTDRAPCLALFNFWAKARKAHSNDDLYCAMLDDNYKVIKEAFVNYQKLDFQGVVVRINKKISAFSFGYSLNKDTFCILYEITDLTIKGLAPFIFRQFCQDLKTYKYINIMDDSGLENLRKVKLSYKPMCLEPAYIVTRDV